MYIYYIEVLYINLILYLLFNMGFSKILANARFSKDWQESVRTFFNQPGHKLRRRQTRAAKAKRF